MAKRQRRTLADYVEAAERREAPRRQARATGRGGWWSFWLGLIAVTVVLLAAAVAFLRYRGMI
jgi:hypothetical protein